MMHDVVHLRKSTPAHRFLTGDCVILHCCNVWCCRRVDYSSIHPRDAKEVTLLSQPFLPLVSNG